MPTEWHTCISSIEFPSKCVVLLAALGYVDGLTSLIGTAFVIFYRTPFRTHSFDDTLRTHTTYTQPLVVCYCWFGCTPCTCIIFYAFAFSFNGYQKTVLRKNANFWRKNALAHIEYTNVNKYTYARTHVCAHTPQMCWLIWCVASGAERVNAKTGTHWLLCKVSTAEEVCFHTPCQINYEVKRNNKNRFFFLNFSAVVGRCCCGLFSRDFHRKMGSFVCL